MVTTMVTVSMASIMAMASVMATVTAMENIE